MRRLTTLAVFAMLVSESAYALQCGPYLVEGATITRTRTGGEVITHYHYLPLPSALSIHTGDIIQLRVSGAPAAEQLRLQWIGADKRIVAAEMVPLRDGKTRDYSLPASFDDYVPAARTLVIEIHAKGLQRCRTELRLHPGD